MDPVGWQDLWRWGWQVRACARHQAGRPHWCRRDPAVADAGILPTWPARPPVRGCFVPSWAVPHCRWRKTVAQTAETGHAAAPPAPTVCGEGWGGLMEICDSKTQDPGGQAVRAAHLEGRWSPNFLLALITRYWQMLPVCSFIHRISSGTSGSHSNKLTREHQEQSVRNNRLGSDVHLQDMKTYSPQISHVAHCSWMSLDLCP